MTERWQNVARATGLLGIDLTPTPSIFSEMSGLAVKFGAANLGQGFPDEDGPEWIRELAVAAIRSGHNQYPPGRGTAELRNAVAAHQFDNYGVELDPEREVLITTGATEALAALLLAITGPGDEVITLEPFYDAHAALIGLSGATHKTVPLVPGSDGFHLDLVALQQTVTAATKVILINTPHNPTGTVLSPAEMQAIAEAATLVDALVVTDEVYEHLIYGDRRHLSMASLPGMRDRTVTISSAGKTFSLTGWKIGWLSGPAEYVDAALTVKQFLTFSGGAPFQPAIATALSSGSAEIAHLRSTLNARKGKLISGLRAAGFTVLEPDGTYFVCADATPFLSEEIPNGAAFARWLPEHVGVACVPVSAFCHTGSPTAEQLGNWVRFTFVKDDATLHLAIERLQTWSRSKS